MPVTGAPRSKSPSILPQVWSGLALSPPADFGLFVDMVFRKCSLEQLGSPLGDYDTGYHRERRCPDWGFALAWGMVGVYARASPDSEGQRLASELAAVEGEAGVPAGASVIDFGLSGAEVFDRVLEGLAAGRLRAAYAAFQTEWGAPGPLTSGQGIGALIDSMRAGGACPASARPMNTFWG